MYTLHLYPSLCIENNEFVLISLMLIKHLRVHPSFLPFIFLNSFSKSEKAVCSAFTTISPFSVTSSPLTYYYVRMLFLPFWGQQKPYLPLPPFMNTLLTPLGLSHSLHGSPFLHSWVPTSHIHRMNTVFKMLRPLDFTLDRHPTFPASDILCWPPVDALLTLLWF